MYGWSLNVIVRGVRVDPESSIGVGLFRPSDHFPIVGKEYRGEYLSADASELSCNFENVETGIYAVSAYHDKNGNFLLDKNFFGVPLEGYGFSNNVRGVFSAPSFSDASITINSDENITVYLNY